MRNHITKENLFILFFKIYHTFIDMDQGSVPNIYLFSVLCSNTWTKHSVKVFFPFLVNLAAAPMHYRTSIRIRPVKLLAR